jgi:hypothetical protein
MATNYVSHQTGSKTTLRKIRQVHPDVSIPDGADLTNIGYSVLEEVAKLEPTQYAIEGAPEEYEPGKWRQTWGFMSLADIKEQKQQSRVQAVISARQAGFQFNGHLVASDTDSWLLIQGAVTMAQLAIAAGTQQALDDFALTLGAGWRAIDQTVVATDAAGVIALGMALAGHMAYCDGVSQAHKAAIDAAESIEALDAIDPTAGYPT